MNFYETDVSRLILRPVVDVVKISILQIVRATRHDVIGTKLLWNRITDNSDVICLS